MATEPRIPPARARRLRAALLAWYRLTGRDLPWRRTTNPYAIWVSEVMLQQTRVETVIPYWTRFLERFPDVASLARAREDDVLARWSGLGYYRRAKLLRRGAKAVVLRHRGRVPADARALRELPGVGRYTAGAIASLAFGLPEAVVDGNVERVLSRWLALELPPGAARERALWSVASALVPAESPGEWNQALMELGATLCAPRAPRCADCPVARFCAAREEGRPERYPSPRARVKPTPVRVAAALIRGPAGILLERRSPVSPLRGEWDLPARAAENGRDRGASPLRALASAHGLALADGRRLGGAKHAILDRRLDLELWEFRTRRRRAGTDGRFVPPERMDGVPVSGATRKLLRLAGDLPPHGRSQGKDAKETGSGRGASRSRGRVKA